MMRTNSRTVLFLSALALLVTGGWLFAGPLNPPPGPVSSSYKTLTEVEPRTAVNAANTPGDADSLFKITQRGSYYLTGNITGVAGKHGIEIVASGVTLDLNGFDLQGVVGMGAFDGITVSLANATSIAVVNGSVRDWGSKGIDLGSAHACRIEGVLANGNASTGIDAGGSGCAISNCSSRANGSGFVIGVGSSIIGCAAHGNTASGIAASFN